MKKLILWAVAVILLAVAVFSLELAHLSKPAPQRPQPTVNVPAATTSPAPDSITHYPIAANEVSNQASEIAPLPSLHDSDAAMRDVLLSLLEKQSFLDYFNIDGIIRRIVATIDNLPRESIAAKVLPLKPVDGEFRVVGDGDTLAMDPSNAERYAPYVSMMQAVNTSTLVSLYARYYPLFQQAYQELGYPNGYFNDRLITVIDHLIACPDAPTPLRLLQPHVYFTFADPRLEHMSAGDKIMFRIGKENADKVKRKLREIRAELIRKSNAVL